MLLWLIWLELDKKTNHQVAARLARNLMDWKRYDPTSQKFRITISLYFYL